MYFLSAAKLLIFHIFLLTFFLHSIFSYVRSFWFNFFFNAYRFKRKNLCQIYSKNISSGLLTYYEGVHSYIYIYIYRTSISDELLNSFLALYSSFSQYKKRNRFFNLIVWIKIEFFSISCVWIFFPYLESIWKTCLIFRVKKKKKLYSIFEYRII